MSVQAQKHFMFVGAMMTTMSNMLVVILLAQVFTSRSRDVLGGEVYQPEWYRLSRELERDSDNET